MNKMVVENKIEKLCCFYVSDFHLEMILLPYINKTIEENKKSATDREVRIFIKDIFNYYNSRCKYNSFIKTNINN